MVQSWFEKSVRIGLFTGVLLAGMLAHAQLQTTPEPASPVVGTPGNYLVTFQPGTSQSDRAASVRRAGAALRFNYSIVDAVAVTIPNVNAFAALQRDAVVLEIFPDHQVFAFAPGNGNGGGGGGATSSSQVTPAGVTRVGAPTSTSNGDGVGVAIGDTGIDLAHPDLAGAIATQTFTAYGSSCQDGHGHGTHVAGIVGARDNTQGVIGVAPKTKLYCVKVLDNTGSGSDSAIIAGLDWVRSTNTAGANPPIRVVNLSLGRSKTSTDTDTSPLRLAVKNLYQNGIVVVAAAGNDSSKEVSQMVPAGFPEVLAVASSTAKDGTNGGCKFFTSTIKQDTASYFTTDGAFSTTTGIGVTISGPGTDQENVSKSCFASSVGILSLKLGGGTTRMSGTSMASPHVAGIVARIMQTPGPTQLSGVETIRTWIRQNAQRINTAPLDSPTSGYSFDGEREGISKAP